MKKLMLMKVVLLLSGQAHASGGDGESSNSPSIPLNSRAHMIYEAVETSLRVLSHNYAGTADQASNLTANMLGNGNASVQISLMDGRNFSYECVPVTETSKGGSIVKTEMACFQN